MQNPKFGDDLPQSYAQYATNQKIIKKNPNRVYPDVAGMSITAYFIQLNFDRIWLLEQA